MASAYDEEVLRRRHEIERTSAELRGTIQAIRNKLDPERLKSQAGEAIREATIGRAEDTMGKAYSRAEDAVGSTRSSIMETIRQNPLPAAITGIGLGWLLMNRAPGKSSSQGYGGGSSYYGESGYRTGERRATTEYFARQQSQLAREGSADGYTGEEESKLGQVADTVGEKASDVQDAAAEMMDRVRTRTGDMMGNAGDTVSTTGQGLLDTIRQNPLPAAIAGFGLGWLFMNGGSRQEQSYSERYAGQFGSEMDPYYGQETSPVENVRSRVGETAGQAQEVVGDLTARAQDTVGQVTDEVQQRAGSMVHHTRRQYGKVEDRFQETLNSNPLAVGAAAVAVGAIAAMMVPATQRERQLMGEARDNLVAQAQSTAQETMDKVQRVADRAQDTAKREAHDEGLTQ